MGINPSSSSSQTIGYRYYMTIHMGIARGPINEIVEIRAGDKMVFPVPAGQPITDAPYPGPGMPSMGGSGGYVLNAPDLFGGDKGEGGIFGNLFVLMGEQDQIASPALTQSIKSDSPDCRGTTTLLYDGLICSLNPYPKSWKFRVRRSTKGWDGDTWHPELAAIPLNNGAVIAMNPAHIIYEAATNRDWGRGFPRTRIDDASFLSAAQTLYGEGFGLCIRYNRQDTLDQFVKSVIDHIGGSIYTSNETGLLTLKLIRDDYSYDDVPIYSYDNGLLSVDRPEVASREDAANEIIVKYRDQIRNEERTLRVHNLASIQTYGVTNSQTVEYPALASDALAARVAHRDLRVASAANRRYTVKLDRSGWRLMPGDVFRVQAPDKGIDDVLLRIGEVKQGSITDGSIEITAVPDIFGLPKGSFINVQQSAYLDVDRAARGAFNATLREATYRDLCTVLSRADLAQLQVSEGYVCGFASKPTSLSLLFTLATKTTSEAAFSTGDSESFSPTVTLKAAIGSLDTSLSISSGVDSNLISVPCAAQIQDEIVRVDAIDLNTGRLTVARGCVDTLPSPHPSNTPVLFFDMNLCFDRREYAAGEIVNSKFLTATSSDVLDANSAATVSTTIIARQGRPYGAANMRINGVSIFNRLTRSTDLLVEWYYRDRTLLQDQLLGFFEGDHVREDGVAYTVEIADASKIYRTVEGLTAQNFRYTLDMANSDGVPSGATLIVRLRTLRQGVSARQELSASVNPA